MADIVSLLSRLGGGAAPGGPPAPGGMPTPGAGPMPAKPNIGPVTTPQPNAGNIHAATEKVKVAVKLLEESLPLIPMGMPLHTEIMQATTKLVKHLSDSASNPGTEMQTLLNLARQSQQSAPMAALGRMMTPQAPAMASGGAPPGGGAEPPAMAA